MPSRLVYPFLPTIARGLGISLASAAQLVTLRVVGSLAAPFVGPLSDRYNRRAVMEIALLLFILGGVALGGIGTLGAAAVAFAFFGLSRAVFDPAQQAYLGDAVPYAQRARAMSFVELSWSGSWLLAVPTAGFLIERFGWRSPWVLLIVPGILSLTLLRTGLPPAYAQAVRPAGKREVAGIVATWRGLLRRPGILPVLAACTLFPMATEIPFIVYGAWLEHSFALGLSTLGVVSIVVGLAETAAEVGSAAYTDRLGKHRSVLVGLLGLAVSLALLPLLARLGLALALGGVALMMLTLEFALVSILPLISELAPDARASLLSFTFASFGTGRAIAAVVGGWLWRWQNIAVNTAVGAALALAAVFILWRYVADDKPVQQGQS